MYISQIENKIRTLKQEINEHKPKSFTNPKLIAVTKNISASDINMLYDLGIRDIGENRVQEIVHKTPELEGRFKVHMIGRLQRNKVKYIMDDVCMIHSLDRLSLAKEIDLRARQKNKVMPVLIQVNVARESQKGGILESDVEEFIMELKDFKGIAIEGLMAIMPMVPKGQADSLRPYFVRMRELFEEVKKKNYSHVEFKHLSMGMSQDYIIAAAEGATMLRIGSAIFAP